jgi:hypothetical protein
MGPCPLVRAWVYRRGVFFDPGMDTAAVLLCMAPEGIGHASDAGCVLGMAQVGHGCFKAAASPACPLTRTEGARPAHHR